MHLDDIDLAYGHKLIYFSTTILLWLSNAVLIFGDRPSSFGEKTEL